jgi:hypothetical protein
VDNAMMDTNRPVNLVGWQFQGRDGKWMLEDNDLDLKHSALDHFMAAFAPNTLKYILLLTNNILQRTKGKRLNREICFSSLEWFYWSQALILGWDVNLECSVVVQVPSLQFGIHAGMSCNCFEEIWMNLVFSAKLEECPADMPSVTYWWMLVENFVDNSIDITVHILAHQNWYVLGFS